MLSVREALLCFILGVTFAVGANAQSSPSDTTIPPASHIIDSGGNVWTLAGGNPLKNGQHTAGSGFNELLYHNGGIYGHAGAGGWDQWYVYASAGWKGVVGDPVSATTIPPASRISDGAGNVWTLVGGKPLKNGQPTAASGISELVYANGGIYAYASAGNWDQWYRYTNSGWGGAAGDPLGSPGSTPPPATSHLGQPIPASLFGMHTQGVSDWPSVPFGVLGKGGAVGWPYLESSRGVYNWSTLDGYVAAAKAHGVQMIYTFDAIPGWSIAGASTVFCAISYTGVLSCRRPPDNMSDWTNFVTALVTRYCPGGVPAIQYYELWNEPYDVYGTGYVQISPTQMAAMTHAAYGIIRSRCPAAKIMTPSMATVAGTAYYNNYAQAYFQALGPPGTDPADIASVHIYAYNQSVDTPESLLPGGSLNNPTTTGIIDTYVAGKPIWNTEGSWRYDTVGLFASTALHAAFVARWYILHWAAGYSSANWYEWDHPLMGTLCATTSPCTPVATPAAAYRQTYGWLVGKVMYNGCAVAGDRVTWSCALSGPGGYAGLIVWDTAGYESYTPPNASRYTQRRDLGGNVTPYSGGSVTIGVAPILLEN